MNCEDIQVKSDPISLHVKVCLASLALASLYLHHSLLVFLWLTGKKVQTHNLQALCFLPPLQRQGRNKQRQVFACVQGKMQHYSWRQADNRETWQKQRIPLETCVMAWIFFVLLVRAVWFHLLTMIQHILWVENLRKTLEVTGNVAKTVSGSVKLLQINTWPAVCTHLELHGQSRFQHRITLSYITS